MYLCLVMAAHTKKQFIQSHKLDCVQLLLGILDEAEFCNVKLMRICQNCRLLFKPWPLHKRADTVTANNDTADGDMEEKSEDVLTPGEKSELEKMDKILNRAQKARELQNKILERSERQQKPPGQQHQKKSQRNESGHDIQDIPKSENEMEESSATVQTAIKQQKAQSQAKKEGQIITNSSNSAVLKAGSNRDVLSCTAPKSNSKSLGVNKITAKSKQKKIAAAHVKAPFQTSANISVPKRSINQQEMIRGKTVPNRARSAQSRLLAAPTTTKNRSKTETKSETHSNEKRHEGFSQICDSRPNQRMSEMEENSAEVLAKLENTKIAESANDPPLGTASIKADTETECHQSLDIKENPKAENTEKMSDGDHVKGDNPGKDNGFNLLTDGHELTLPVKLRRLHSQNLKLRQKLHLHCLTKKVETEKCKQEFVDKVELSFCGTEEWRVGRSVSKLCSAYTEMYNLITSLSLDSLAEDSSAAVVCRAKSILEFLLILFSQLEEQRLHLHTEILGKSDCVQSESPLHLVEHQIHPLYQWLPSSVLQDSNFIPVSAPLIQYKFCRDLERLGYVIFQIQYLTVNHYILDTIMTEILPVIEKMDPTSSEFIQMIRFLYTVVSDGQTLPVVLMDTINDLEESVADES